MLEVLSILVLGFVLGMRHSFDSDHIVAIINMTAKTKSFRKATLQGIFWGLGHTVMLLIVGIAVLLLSLSISKEIQSYFESIVGLMIIVLGLSSLLEFHRERVHLHSHKHDQLQHTHFHSHKDEQDHMHPHGKSVFYRPFMVGIFHGLAGSGALMVLILSTISSFYLGILYILIFGLGSVISMSGISTLISLPFIFTKNIYQNLHSWLRVISATGGIIFGIYYISLFLG